MAMSMDTLVTALLDLSGELPEFPTPMLIGGGFGLYLKQRHMEEEQPPIDNTHPWRVVAPGPARPKMSTYCSQLK